MKQFALALLVASASAVKLSTYGDCDWECNSAGSGSPEEQWRSYGYPHRGADLKKPLDHQQRWDTYLPDYAQKAACNCANFVQKSWTPGYTGTWTNDQHLDWFQPAAGAQHAGTMGWANEKEAARTAAVAGQASSDVWRGQGLKTAWESA